MFSWLFCFVPIGSIEGCLLIVNGMDLMLHIGDTCCSVMVDMIAHLG